MGNCVCLTWNHFSSLYKCAFGIDYQRTKYYVRNLLRVVQNLCLVIIYIANQILRESNSYWRSYFPLALELQKFKVSVGLSLVTKNGIGLAYSID